ncbi:MAG: hypothetical protein ABEJ97_06470 [Halobellus sp.]
METSQVVFGLHAVIGAALAAFGLLSITSGGIVSGGVNVLIGAAVVFVGFRVREMV